jgi:hypothetical protein
MDEELVPQREHKRGEIVDVGVPVPVKGGSDQEPCVVVEQDRSGVVDGADARKLMSNSLAPGLFAER